MNVADPGQGLIHVFTSDGEFVEAHSLPASAGVSLAAYRQMRAGSGFGWSRSTFTWGPRGKVDNRGKLMWKRNEAVEVFAEYSTVTPIYHERKTGVQWGPFSSLAGSSALWTVLGDSTVVIADALSGLVSWYRFDVDGVEQYRVSDVGIRGATLSTRQRSRAIAAERAILGSYWPRDVDVWFPKQITGIVDMIADGQGCLWLQRRPASPESAANSWRVVAPNGGLWADVLLPDEIEVKEINDRRILGVVRDELDAPVIVMYEFDRSALVEGMASGPEVGRGAAGLKGG